MPPPEGVSCRARETSAIPPTAQAMPAATCPLLRSRRATHDISATIAGMAAMMTPAASAEVSATPKSMKMEKRKLPKKDSKKSSVRSRRLSGASPGWRLTHEAMATAAMPKRSQASRKTGKTSTSVLESAT